MFNCRSCNAKDQEIEFLREQVKELNDRLLSLCGDALSKFNMKELAKEPVSPPHYVDPLGAIQSMTAETEEEIKEKQAALDQVQQIMGH